MSNAFTNTRIEYHILQSFPVTCLNRDDVGAPKSAIVGGVSRARVSSQCWKRQVRLALHESNFPMGTRTRHITDIVAEACEENGASHEQAIACGQAIESAFIKENKKKAKKSTGDQDEGENEAANETLVFFSPAELKTIASRLKELRFDASKFLTGKKPEDQAKQIGALLKEDKDKKALDALDIALFGRMVAKAPDMNVEAAASFAHAISMHKVSNEVEFFSALDDLQKDPGAAHMGSLEYNSATYYRYISLDLGQLAQTIGAGQVKAAVDAFTKALFMARPAARQATQSGASSWDFARVFVRRGQRIQASFEEPVQKAQGGGFSKPSVEALKTWSDKHEKLWGSLYGKVAACDYGEDDNFSIDDLIACLLKAISAPQAEEATA